jgi:GSCFA family
MQFRTELAPKPSDCQIGLNSQILTIGSCFADVIGSELKANKINTLVNPFGTVFNPVSIQKQLDYVTNNLPPDPQLFVQNQDVHLHYDFHSSFWNTDKLALELGLKNKISEVRQFAKQTDILIVTLGTAFVYRHLASNQIVANCHKTPSQAFQKELVGLNEITGALNQLIFKLSNSQIILTLSPVRHTRDGLEGNQVSKSLLRVACHEIAESLPNVHYFPAYELLLDDLRDYRFYKPDLIHPNEVAEAYIFEKFAENYFTEDLKAFLKQWQPVRNALKHNILQQGTLAHRQFVEKLLRKLEKLNKTVDMSAEMAKIKESFPLLLRSQV